MVKFLKCLDCGHFFKSPFMDYKTYGSGFTIPGLGVIRCPECAKEKRRKYFQVVTEQKTSVKGENTRALVANPPSEEDLIEDSKYEDE